MQRNVLYDCKYNLNHKIPQEIFRDHKIHTLTDIHHKFCNDLRKIDYIPFLVCFNDHCPVGHKITCYRICQIKNIVYQKILLIQITLYDIFQKWNQKQANGQYNRYDCSIDLFKQKNQCCYSFFVIVFQWFIQFIRQHTAKSKLSQI